MRTELPSPRHFQSLQGCEAITFGKQIHLPLVSLLLCVRRQHFAACSQLCKVTLYARCQFYTITGFTLEIL